MSSKKHIFSNLEKKCFMDILKRFSQIIENKETDGSSLQAKNDAWDSITREYNASPYTTVQVTHKQLRRLWMNLKQRQRDAMTKERQHRVATGGGPSTSAAEIDPDVAQVAPALLVSVDEAIDSDTLPEPLPIIVMESMDVPTEAEPTPAFSQAPSTSSSQHPQSTTALPAPSQTSPLPLPPPSQTPPFPLPPPSSSLQRHKNSVIEKEYGDRKRRAEELHILELELIRHRVREAKAKADLAEYILQQKRSANTLIRDDEEGTYGIME